MAKEKSSKDKKESKKEKRAEKNGVSKSSKKEKSTVDTAALVQAVAADSPAIEVVEAVAAGEVPLAALVPFANPLADDKTGKKVLKGVKKAAKSKSLKRGVKEVVKALRKSPTDSNSTAAPAGVVVLAADISPMDVISHIPVLCEDHGVPYVYVTSRAELGAAGATKRPTSVVMLSAEVGKGGEGKEEWKETYADLVKVVRKAGKDVRI